jgi:hypothetical protein
MTAAGARRFTYVGISALLVLAPAADAITDGRCANAQLTRKARSAPVPSMEPSTRSTPRNGERNLREI